MNERNLASEVVAEVKKAVVGKDAVLVKVLAAILARGHILLEDIPGVGKTTLALAFAKALNLQFSRVQFTPDVMPSDITGFSIYDKTTGKMEYQPGAVMCNLFLADELNRATSRTQSALLEAMEEGQVTVDGVSRPVPQPFMVIATQNPVGASGTQKLPDSQLDRFLLRLSMGYPSEREELELLRRRQYGQAMDGVARAVDREQLEQMRQAAGKVHVSEEIMQYIIRLVNATRKHPPAAPGGQPPGHAGRHRREPLGGLPPGAGLCGAGGCPYYLGRCCGSPAAAGPRRGTHRQRSGNCSRRPAYC